MELMWFNYICLPAPYRTLFSPKHPKDSPAKLRNGDRENKTQKPAVNFSLGN
jgi:hypothetical protein